MVGVTVLLLWPFERYGHEGGWGDKQAPKQGRWSEQLFGLSSLILFFTTIKWPEWPNLIYLFILSLRHVCLLIRFHFWCNSEMAVPRVMKNKIYRWSTFPTHLEIAHDVVCQVEGVEVDV